MIHALHPLLQVTIAVLFLALMIWPETIGNDGDRERDDAKRLDRW